MYLNWNITVHYNRVQQNSNFCCLVDVYSNRFVEVLSFCQRTASKYIIRELVALPEDYCRKTHRNYDNYFPNSAF